MIALAATHAKFVISLDPSTSWISYEFERHHSIQLLAGLWTWCVIPLIVYGGFTEWSQYGQCSSSCGTGTQIRTRTCTNPPPVNNGSDCQGPRNETHRIVPQDHAQVKFSSHQSSSVGSYRSGNYYDVKYVNDILVLNISQFWMAAFVLTAIISAVSFKIIQTFCINDKMQNTYLWLTLSETVEACQWVLVFLASHQNYANA